MSGPTLGPSIEPLAQTEDGSIVWVKRDGCTAAAARRWVAIENGDGTIGEWKVSQCYLRELRPEDCPVHPDEGRDEWTEDEDCRCYEIEVGWWEECSHREPGAVRVFRVAALSDQPTHRKTGGE